MKRTILYILLLSAGIATQATAQSDTLKKSNVHLGFIYPLSTNGTNAPTYSNGFSFNLLAGISRSEEACTISGLVTIVKEKANGVQFAGLANLIGNTATGAQVAGVINIVKGETEGLQLGGVINITDTMQGAQIAGVINIDRKTRNGLQIGGVANLATDINVQAAGIINIAHNVNGIQIATINDAQTVHGAQISGLVSRAKRVKGLQIGVINIADTGDYAIGVVNLIKNGEKGVSITEDETFSTVAAFRSGGKRVYTIIGIGYNYKTSKAMYIMEGGIGLHVPVVNHFLINLEAVSTSLEDFNHTSYMKGSFRVLADYKVNRTFQVFAGPSVNAVFPSNAGIKNIADDLTWNFTSYGSPWGISIGGVVGVQFCF